MDRRKANIKQRRENKMKKYFEKIDPATNSNKFWEIAIKDKKIVIVRFGRIGNKAQEKVFDKKKGIKNEAEARKFYEKKITEKIRKGYEEIN